MDGGGSSTTSAHQAFKDLFERCLSEAHLGTQSLHREMLRRTGYDMPENTIDSWRRPHSTTGQPSLPGESKVQILAQWLCGLDEVTVTEEDLLAAWRADKAATTRTFRHRRPSCGWPEGSTSRASSTPPSTCTWTASLAASTTAFGSC